jgi:hypothetical protein
MTIGGGLMSYQIYGIDPILMERVKPKLKNPEVKKRIKMVLYGVTKYDLQDRAKVAKLVAMGSKALGEKFSDWQANNLIDFIIAQKIDPTNTFHLIKLWNMFR